MNIDLFKEFLVLANTQSFADAAEELFISQASLSRHMNLLESELNVELFDRKYKKFHLSEYGLMLVPYAQAMANSFNNLLNRYLAQADAKKQVINIGIANGCDRIIEINHLIAEFSISHPQARFDVTNDYTSVLLESIKDHIFDFVFIREKDSSQDNPKRSLFAQDSLGAYMSTAHPLAQRERISIHELKTLPVVAPARHTLSTTLFFNECQKAGFTPWIAMHGTHQQISRYLRSGSGVGIMFKGVHSSRHTDHDLVVIDIEPEITADINLLYDSKNFTDTKKEFLDLLLSKLGK